MALQVICPACQETLSLQTPLVGEDATCPHCDRKFNIHLEGQIRISPVSAARNTFQSTDRSIRFTFSCLRCAAVLEAMDRMCGQSGRCPTCGAIFLVPPVDPDTGLAIGNAQVADDGQHPTPMHAYATAGARAPRIIRRGDGRQVIICPRCNREMSVDADACSGCGVPFTMEGAEIIAQGVGETNTAAQLALVCGVLALPTFCFPVVGLVAIVFGVIGMKRASLIGPEATGRRMAIIGMALGLLSICVFFLSLLLQ